MKKVHPSDPVPTWGFSRRGDKLAQWPKDASGVPEHAVFLTSCRETDSQADILTELLSSYGIPALRNYDIDGMFGKVVLGFSGYGVSLYVPESRLEEARDLIQPVDDKDM